MYARLPAKNISMLAQTPSSRCRWVARCATMLLFLNASLAAHEVVADKAAARLDTNAASLGNAAIAAKWKIVDDHLSDFVVGNEGGESIRFDAPFAVLLADGTRLDASSWRVAGTPQVDNLPVDATASRLADRLPGQGVQMQFVDEQGRLRVDWQVQQRDGSAYLRERITLTALKQDEAIAEADTLLLTVPNQLGVAYNAHVIEMILKHVAPALGWR